MRETIWHHSTDQAPAPGAYSQAVSADVGNSMLLFLAGQTGNVPNGKDEPVIEGGIGPQTTQALKNILAVVKSANGNINHIVEIKVFIKDSEIGTNRDQGRAESRIAFNTAYIAFFAEHGIRNLPARTMVWVSEIPLEAPAEETVIELTATAVIPKDGMILE